jgi:hypothetical protein
MEDNRVSHQNPANGRHGICYIKDRPEFEIYEIGYKAQPEAVYLIADSTAEKEQHRRLHQPALKKRPALVVIEKQNRNEDDTDTGDYLDGKKLVLEQTEDDAGILVAYYLEYPGIEKDFTSLQVIPDP